MFHVKQSPRVNLPNVSRETFVGSPGGVFKGAMFHVKH
jgi:hypothetical protein